MIRILENLEPIKIEKNSYLIEELDEFNMVIFFDEGKYKIGYSLNRNEEYKLFYNGVNVIGAYAVTFNKRALFIYKTVSQCSGYFIRKSNWKNIFSDSDYSAITEKLKMKLKKQYIKFVKFPLMEAKKKDAKKIAGRADFDMLLSLQAIK